MDAVHGSEVMCRVECPIDIDCVMTRLVEADRSPVAFCPYPRPPYRSPRQQLPSRRPSPPPGSLGRRPAWCTCPELPQSRRPPVAAGDRPSSAHPPSYGRMRLKLLGDLRVLDDPLNHSVHVLCEVGDECGLPGNPRFLIAPKQACLIASRGCVRASSRPSTAFCR